MDKIELIRLIENEEPDSSLETIEELDDMVYAVADRIASDTNNSGPHGQVDFLIRNGVSVEQIAKRTVSKGS